MDVKKYLGGDISVYVGTYRKYNEGSIKGAWVNMEAVRDVDQFWRICRTIHKERDPEFMFQDFQGFPEWLYGESMGSDEIAEILRYAHATPEERARIACEDEEPADTAVPLADALRAALLLRLGKTAGTAAPKQLGMAGDKALLEEYVREMEKAWPNDKGMLDYFRKKWSGGVRLQNGGILCFEKPSIETRFCFHDEGPDYEYYKELMADKETRLKQYFIDQNLGSMDETIRALEVDCRYPQDERGYRYDGKAWYLERVSYSSQREPLNVWCFHAWCEYDVRNEPYRYKPGTYEKMTEADRLTILAGMRRERDKFERRLQSYLKRYGVSKIHTWTYWADA